MGSRLAAVSRWLAPSVVAAALAAFCVGLAEGRGVGVQGLAAAIGLAWLAIGPLALAGALVVRGLYRAWRAPELAARLVDPDGSWPQLAAWVLVVWGAMVGVAWLLFQTTWRLASWTAFKPLAAGFVTAVMTVVSVALVLALALPVATLLARGLRALDHRWRARGHATVLRPTAIILAGIAIAALTTALTWRYFMARRVTHLALAGIRPPAVAVLGVALGHAGWHWLGGRRRTLVGCVLVAATLAAVVTTLHVVASRPALALALWGKQPFVRAPLERIADLETIRGSVPRETYRPRAKPRADHRDLVLVTLGAVRADALPPYGGTAALPALRELGLRSVVFQWHFAATTAPLHALRAMLIGLDPARVKARAQLDPRHVLLADRLRAGGYATAGFLAARDPAALARGGLTRGLDHVVVDALGTRVVDAAQAWLRARDARPPAGPLFLWLHLELPPAPAQAASDAASRRQEYDAQLAVLDAQLHTLMRAVAARSPDRAPLVVVTSDRGASLGEHPASGSAPDLFNPQLRVPLLIAGPSLRAMQVGETTSTTDLVPTLLELAGFTAPEAGLDGHSLAGVARGERPAMPTEGTAFAQVGPLRAVVKGGWKLLVNGTAAQLFDLRGDPAERTNQLARRPTLMQTLQDLLDQHAADVRRAPFP